MTDLDWRVRAECRKYPPELWFPERSNQSSDAVAICAECPVIRQCAEYHVAIGESNAIVAGFRCSDEREKAALEAWVGKERSATLKRRYYVRSAPSPKPAGNLGRCVSCKAVTVSGSSPKPGEKRYHACGRCHACYGAMRRAEEQEGKSSPTRRVSSVPAREHMRTLKDAMTIEEIMAAAGVSRGTVNELLYGRRQRVTAETSQRVLSTQVPVTA